jgi:hypothetical protein
MILKRYVISLSRGADAGQSPGEGGGGGGGGVYSRSWEEKSHLINLERCKR